MVNWCKQAGKDILREHFNVVIHSFLGFLLMVVVALFLLILSIFSPTWGFNVPGWILQIATWMVLGGSIYIVFFILLSTKLEESHLS